MTRDTNPQEDTRTTSPISSLVRTEPTPTSPAELYLDLLKRTLTRTVVAKSRERQTLLARVFVKRLAIGFAQSILKPLGLELVRVVRCGPNDYLESGDSSRNRAEDAETMLGTRQFDSMQACVTDVIRRGVPGDLLEAGVWRGGMTIFMKAVLRAHGDTTRKVWVTDSFAGLPELDRKVDSFGWRAGDMSASLQEVSDNFARYGLLDNRVVFLQGFFDRTLPSAPISELAILRVDADLYASTRTVLHNLYSKLSPGGYAIFDDYQNLPDCRRAIDEFRTERGISDPIRPIDARAVFWQKSA